MENFCSHLSQSCNLESPKSEMKFKDTELDSLISSLSHSYILFQSMEFLNFIVLGDFIIYYTNFSIVVPQRSVLHLLWLNHYIFMTFST